jgi:hypothetical protein
MILPPNVLPGHGSHVDDANGVDGIQDQDVLEQLPKATGWNAAHGVPGFGVHEDASLGARVNVGNEDDGIQYQGFLGQLPEATGWGDDDNVIQPSGASVQHALAIEWLPRWNAAPAVAAEGEDDHLSKNLMDGSSTPIRNEDHDVTGSDDDGI